MTDKATIDRAIQAIRRTELDCADWGDPALQEIVEAVLSALEVSEPITTDEELEEAAKSDNALLADMAKMELHRRGKGPAPWKITGIDRSPTFWKIRNSRG